MLCAYCIKRRSVCECDGKETGRRSGREMHEKTKTNVKHDLLRMTSTGGIISRGMCTLFKNKKYMLTSYLNMNQYNNWCLFYDISNFTGY